MTLHSDDIAETKADIAEEGEACVFTLPSSAPDADKPWEDDADAEPTTANASVLFLPTGRIGTETLIRLGIAGKEIPAGFVVGYVGGTPVLTNKHICERTNGRKYAVISNDKLEPNGELILQTVLFQQIK